MDPGFSPAIYSCVPPPLFTCFHMPVIMNPLKLPLPLCPIVEATEDATDAVGPRLDAIVALLERIVALLEEEEPEWEGDDS